MSGKTLLLRGRLATGMSMRGSSIVVCPRVSRQSRLRAHPVHLDMAAGIRLDIDGKLGVADDAATPRGPGTPRAATETHPRRLEDRVARGAAVDGRSRELGGLGRASAREGDEPEVGGLEESLQGRGHDGQAGVYDAQGDLETGPEGVLDDGHGEVELGLGFRELNNVVCAPSGRKTNTRRLVSQRSRVEMAQLVLTRYLDQRRPTMQSSWSCSSAASRASASGELRCPHPE